MLSFSFSDEIKDDNSTLQEQNLTKQVDKLNKTINNANYNKFVEILNKYPNLINVTDSEGLRPLEHAMVFAESIDEIIAKNKLFKKTEKANHYEFFDYLIEKGADLNYEVLDTQLTLIQHATIALNEEYLIDFVNKNIDKIDINLNYNDYRTTVLTLAHKHNKKNLFECYIKNGAIVNDALIIDIVYNILVPFYEKTQYFSIDNSTLTDEQLALLNSKEYQLTLDNELDYLSLSIKHLKNRNDIVDDAINRLLKFQNLTKNLKLKNILTKEIDND